MSEEELKARLESKIRSCKQRLQGLCDEKVEVAKLLYLGFEVRDKVFQWYDHEIEVCNELIESYSNRLEEIKGNETI